MRRGFILIIVLSLLGLLAFISIAFVQSSVISRGISRQYLDQAHVNLLVNSGYEMALSEISQNITYDGSKGIPIGEGLLVGGGDTVDIAVADLSGRININDGVLAGQAEVDFKRPNGLDDHFNHYYANELNPYPRDLLGQIPPGGGGGGAAPPGDDDDGGSEPRWDSIDDPIKVKGEPPTAEDIDIYERARSALINLRLRRILNAYGDVHRFVDQAYQGDPDNLLGADFHVDKFVSGDQMLPTPPFSVRVKNSSDALVSKSMSGEKNLELNENYNNGLGDRIIELRPEGGYESLHEIKKIANDWAQETGIELSAKYLKGESFFDLIKNDLTLSSYHDTRFYRLDDETRIGNFYSSDLNNSEPRTRGWFEPRDLQTEPPNFSFMWIPHPVALINLNDASFFVRAAIFYAPTNVSYLCEGATAIFPYGNPERDSRQYFDTYTAYESLIPSPSIGVAPATFNLDKQGSDISGNWIDHKALEHGLVDKGRHTHLVTMRDALELAYKYEKYAENLSPGWIRNFDDFRIFLESFNIYGTQVPPGEEKTWEHLAGFEKVINTAGITIPYYRVADYDDRGIFYWDYLSKTLPHVMSCVRRLPGFLGAPLALQSPYMLLQPDYSIDYGLSGNFCRQPFRKAEDFVWRFPHPKVNFAPTGYYSIQVDGQMRDAQNKTIASKIEVLVKSFETLYYRSQQDFVELTDFDKTHSDIRLGPEYINQAARIEASKYLGVVGLKDFEGDLIEHADPLKMDSYMNFQGGYQPQVVLNFNPEDPLDTLGGFKNLSIRQDIAPERQDPNNDPWKDALNSQSPDGEAAALLDDSLLEGDEVPQLGDTSQPDGMSDLSPFGGARLMSLGHGQFAENGFSDSLYYRLDPWLDNGSPGISRPVGQDLSSGLMTFWFQIPSGYGFPNYYVDQDPDNEFVNGNLYCYSWVLVSLNFWERYQTTLFFTPITRPVSITVGLKNTAKQGLNLFARYDSGGESFVSDTAFVPGYIAPANYELTDQVEAEFEIDEGIPNYSMLNFLCFYEGVETYREEDPLHPKYFFIAHRSSEVSATLNDAASILGSWHRVSVSWNLRWEPEKMTSDQQLFIDFHDQNNKTTNEQSFKEREFHQGVSYLSGDIGDPYDYPRDSNPPENGGSIGFMHPFNSSMVVSLGEAQSRRLVADFFSDRNIDYETKIGTFYPYWRLNSCLDNFRLFIGPSDPADPKRAGISDFYFDPANLEKTATENAYGAMRYKIMSTQEGYHADYTDEDREPVWSLDPGLSEGAKLLALGSRIYYPTFPPSNIPQVLLGLTLTGDEKQWATSYVDVSDNEQDFLYPRIPLTENSRLFFQYKAYKVHLDGDPQAIGGIENEGEPLLYIEQGWDLGYHLGGHVTEIPWIKEVSIRYQNSETLQVLRWDEVTH